MAGRSLIVSDVDGTLLGDDDALDRFCQWLAPRRDGFSLVYSSGRFFNSIVESVRTTALPVPDAVIGGVGTDIRLWSDATGHPLESWSRQFLRWDAAKISRILQSFDWLQLQPAEFLSEFKLSYFARDVTSPMFDRLRRTLTESGFEVEIVYSSNRDLDILPAGANKGTAAGFLASHWGVAARQVHVAGDSGNDLAMFSQDFRGIVVGNAHPELKALNAESVYHSAFGYADGVRDGLEYWSGCHQRAGRAKLTCQPG